MDYQVRRGYSFLQLFGFSSLFSSELSFYYAFMATLKKILKIIQNCVLACLKYLCKISNYLLNFFSRVAINKIRVTFLIIIIFNKKVKKMLSEPISLQDDSISLVEQKQNLPAKIYNQQLNFWLDFIHKYNTNQTNIDPFSSKYFKDIFLKNLNKKFKICIIYDNLIVESICLKLKKPQYKRFSAISVGTINFHHINLDESQQKLYEAEKWINLLKISQVLYQYKFISKIYYKKVEEICYNQKPIESQLMEFYNMSKQNDKISLKTWNKAVQLDCRLFWTETIYEWPTLVPKSKIIQDLYYRFEKYLANKLNKNKIKQLQQFIFSPKKQVYSDYLSEVADSLCLFNYPKSVQAIKDQLKTFQIKLKQAFQLSNLSLKILKFQIYGSFRSRICLETSDVDLTLFITYNNGQLVQNTQEIKQCVKKTYYCLNKFQRVQDQQLQIENSFFVLNCKVPFIRINFSQQKPLSQMDIVINNHSGVLNSSMLEAYSENKKLRNLGVILKLWGKRNKLIDPQKLSSYGLILMLLYFLMSSGYLRFPTQQQLLNRRFGKQFQIQEDIVHTLIKFFQFYERSSNYHENEQIACLISGCKDHSHLPRFVINIHDPFDDSNPGRLKQRDRLHFFLALQKTLSQLQDAVTYNEVNKRQKINDIFGFNFEEIQDSEPIIVE